MAMVSVLAVASARVWWVVAYWTPRARTFRRRIRALELGVEWQDARDRPADDAWRQQVEQEIGRSASTVPMTAELLSDSIERGVPVSRRWRRRHQRAIARARSGLAGADIHGASRAVVPRRRVLARVVPVAAALSLGVVLGPALQHSLSHSHPVGGQVGAYRYECSQCKPGAAHGPAALDYARRIRVGPPEPRPSWLLTDAQLRAAQRRSSQASGSR